MAAPCVLIVSCSDFQATELIKRILGTEILPSASRIIENIDAYSWHIDTKYYTADINLCTTPVKTIGSQEFAQCVEAVVIYFDSSQKAGLESVNQWLPFIKPSEASVQLLICDRCGQSSAVSHLQAQEWCLQNSFELVELDPEENDSDNEDNFAETTGIKRIIQALQAHTWANLELKEKPFRSPRLESLLAAENSEKNSLEDSLRNISISAMNENSVSPTFMYEDQRVPCASGNHLGSGDDQNKDSANTSNINLESLLEDDLALFQSLADEDPEGQSFEQLFERFRIMKEKAEKLPFEERKEYAEKVTLAFWRAIGGDEDEIEGLDLKED